MSTTAQRNTTQTKTQLFSVATSQEEAARLAAQIAGEVLLPEDDGYAAECSSYNLNHALEPALVVVARSTADVQAAVRFATKREIPVAVKATGHNTVRRAHGALLITTQHMNHVGIDIENRTVRIESGVRWAQVITAAAEYGLAPMNGSSPLVGAIGYTLGGGHSPPWSRSKGYAADRVISFEVVTAGGDLRHVSENSHSELFWALRGGQGNFGIVTAMVCELFPQGRFYGGGLWYPLEHISRVIPAWREWTETLPEAASSSFAIQRLPPLPELPAPLQGASVIHLRFIHLGSSVDGEKLFAPMRVITTPILDTVNDHPYTSIGMIHMDPQRPTPYWDRTMSFRDFSTEAIDELIALTGPDSGCPLMSFEVRQLGGAMDREPSVPNAVATRGIPYILFGFGIGSPEKEETMKDYLDYLMGRLGPWSDDRLVVNGMSATQGITPAQLQAVYGSDRYQVLARTKRLYDPLNIFRMNHNIVPASAQMF